MQIIQTKKITTNVTKVGMKKPPRYQTRKPGVALDFFLSVPPRGYHIQLIQLPKHLLDTPSHPLSLPPRNCPSSDSGGLLPRGHQWLSQSLLWMQDPTLGQPEKDPTSTHWGLQSLPHLSSIILSLQKRECRQCPLLLIGWNWVIPINSVTENKKILFKTFS